MAISDRERKLLIFGGGAFVLFILLYFVVPALFSSDKTPGVMGSQRKDLMEIMTMYKDFSNIRTDFNKIEAQIKKQKDFSILTELESLAEKAEIKNNIESMESKPKPKNEFFKEQSVDVRLIKVNLKQLLSFLYSIEYSTKILRVKKLHVDVRFDDADLVNASLEVSTFKPLE